MINGVSVFPRESVEAITGGDGHSAREDILPEVRVWKISSNCGLSIGSCLQQSSVISQMGSGIDGQWGRAGPYPLAMAIWIIL